MTSNNTEISRINALVQDILADPAIGQTTAQLARLCGMSTERFKAAFKEHTGTTVQQFLTESKMKKAARLMAASNVTIKEISASLGYSELSSFYRAFKKYFGTTPLQYCRHRRT